MSDWRRGGTIGFIGLVAIVWLAVAGCGGDDDSSPTGPGPGPSGPQPGELMAEFSLVDVNPNSATTGQPVSPRQYLSKVSAWYFGHAT